MGVVCHASWESQDTRVVCRQLGHSVAGNIRTKCKSCKLFLATGSVALRNDEFGFGFGKSIHLGQIHCSGDESKLALCAAGSTHRCSHAYVAGVRCQERTV